MTRRPWIIDTTMFRDEFELLEMRLETMADAVDWFVVVEADVDHQNHPKPYHLSDNLARFKEWDGKLSVVRASGLPTTDHEADPWAREWAQRDWTWQGLLRLPGVMPQDIVLHGDIDEVCDPLYVRNVRPKARQFVSFGQRLHCFAVDWQHPDEWGGTVAVTVATAMEIGHRRVVDGQVIHPGAWQIVRNQRNGLVPQNFEHLGSGWDCVVLHDAGWHFSWLGGRDADLAKVDAFCHPEIVERTLAGLESDRFRREGFHVDGRKMEAVEVDESWPAFIRERRCPESWWRPR